MSLEQDIRTVEIEMNLTKTAPDYAMFTMLGNAAVHAVVEKARADQMSWAQTYRALCALGEQPQFGEATDTAVREYVYDALGFQDNFYV